MLQQNQVLKIALFTLITFNLLHFLYQPKFEIITCKKEALPLWDKTIDFWKESYNNETGNPTGCYLVPNYVHFIRFNNPEVNYVDMICILAAFKNQKPDKIFFHKNFNTSFIGKYWEVLENTKGFLDIVEFKYVAIPTEIFGQQLRGSHRHTVFHAADIVRIQVMMQYGGIIVDHDSYIVQSLNPFRHYEMTLNWDEDQYLGTQILVGHKDARFLQLYLDSYRDYRPDLWYYNAGERPTVEILYKMPELIHRVKVWFGVDNKFIFDLFEKQWSEWKRFYTIHLLIGHQGMLHTDHIAPNAKYPVMFDENNIGYYPVTFREMAYDVYDIAGIKWPKARFN